jgi:hypothetical protein
MPDAKGIKVDGSRRLASIPGAERYFVAEHAAGH